MAVTAAKSVMAFRVLTMAVDLCRLTTRTMNVNAGHERTSKARIIHQIQLIRGITRPRLSLHKLLLPICRAKALLLIQFKAPSPKKPSRHCWSVVRWRN
ncbi:Transposase [Shigella dysenteriae 1617]|uniref:Transposase n=2 Tax=Shigella dysenteriae 1617 TaxID=754093 RepID=A0A0A6ZX36_SHIDY|nr:Transposase [Shigella dysenteriae 1617]